MKRFQDWPERLAAWVETAKRTPFVWGVHDCCLAAGDWVLAATGTDAAARWRGKYKTAAEAVALLAADGGLEGAVTAVLGAPLKTPLLGQRGDIALMPADDAVSGMTVCLGVVNGSRVLVLTEKGCAPLRLAQALKVWRV